MNRRDFMAALGALSCSLSACQQKTVIVKKPFDDFLKKILEDFDLPGLSLAVTNSRELIYAGGQGFANVAQKVPMTADSLLNVGSISKTVTATAVMQLWEQERLTLDQDVNDFLDFGLRNPKYPDVPITFRQLLAHRSSVSDGPAYAASYFCGDPRISLADWIREYFSPEGRFWNKDNFHAWSPGTPNPPEQPRPYSNVGYGLLGRLVELISGQDFAAYCQGEIFQPLGMEQTSWFLRDLDISTHAIPYTRLADDFKIEEDQSLVGMLPQDGLRPEDLQPGGLFPHCLYSFFNYPDGLLRSSVTHMASFLRAYMQAQDSDQQTLLRPATVHLMLSKDHFGESLCWSPREANSGNAFWGHSGGDPGISTYLGFQPGADLGLVVFFNSASPRAAHDRVFFEVQSVFG